MISFLNPALVKALRYIISGGSAAVVNIGTLYLLTHYFSVWYIAASIIAFLLSFVVSFTLQRTWTFEVKGNRSLVEHTTLYFLVVLGNLFLNTGFVFVFVEYLHLSYVLAQFLAGLIISFVSFFLYRRIFKI